jgi:seryl-tRNA synthetase
MTFVSKFEVKPKVAEQALIEGLFRRSSPIDGVYGRTESYGTAYDALNRFISKYRQPNVESLSFPPVIDRKIIERLGYLKSFPNLLGCVCGLSGSEREISSVVDRANGGGEWTNSLSAHDLVLAPAACYAIYPLAAARTIPSEGLSYDVCCECFRREPSSDVDRMQSFRMREFVSIGTEKQTRDFRDQWLERAKGFADKLGLNYRIAPASDPFFGRAGALLSQAQAEQQLKFELLVPVRSVDRPTACMSFNCHQDHFGIAMDLRGDDGATCHSACVAFGMDRLVVALFASHGVSISDWPSSVREALVL